MRPEPARMRMSFHEKVWGSPHLAPWFPAADSKIGEVWYEADRALPVLVKLLFTCERLSVQVHPADDYAVVYESSSGKTEMWHVLRAAPGAAVAVGLTETVTPERLRELAVSGEIEQYLAWLTVRPGDTVFIPAGTIHAIGPGLVLCEIQQFSDVTYRLYDYGRPRELHLDRAVDVAVPGPYVPPAAPPEGFIAHCRYFAVEELKIAGTAEITPRADRFELLIALEGAGRLDQHDFRLGETWYVPEGTMPFTIETPEAARFLRVFVP
jgi:mannose-6-phosphate isomerase